MTKEKWGGVFESLVTTAADVLQTEAEMEQEQANRLGESIAYKFAKYEGGTVIYFPRAVSQRLAKRDIEIRKKFNGMNYAELATEYGLTQMRIRQILAKPKK